MNNFTQRLRWCLKHGDMTTADMRHWFGRPYPTVRTWLHESRIPQGPAGKRAHLLLDLLERKIKKRKGFPIPVDISAHARPNYVKQLRHDATSARVPASHSAG